MRNRRQHRGDTGSAFAGAALFAWCLVLFSATAPAFAQDSDKGGSGADTTSGIAARQAMERQETVKKAQDLLTAAEFARADGRNEEAVRQYLTAYRMLPAVPATQALRDSIFKRLQQGSKAYAEELIAKAQWKEAAAALDQVMSEARDSGVSPGEIDPGVRQLLAQLKSDDHFNKAMTPEHLQNVDKVEKLLREANGAIEIAAFDKARDRFNAVLNIDRYNSAARRGLETVERMIAEYDEIARSQTRSTMLREVAGQWESPVPNLLNPGAGAGFSDATAGSQKASLLSKLQNIFIPQVQFESTPLETAIEYLTQVSQQLDTQEGDPNLRGVNIVIDPQTGGDNTDLLQRPVTLQLNNAPLGDVLGYVTRLVGMKYKVDSFAVTIIPLSSQDDVALQTLTFRVPPGFMTNEQGAGGGAGAAAADPFAAPQDAGAGGGTLVKRLTAREVLESRGVTFPQGAVANFNPGTGMLIVKNTPDNLSLVETLIQNSKDSGAKLVKVDVKIIETSERTLNELGLDTLLGQANLPGSNKVFTSGGTYGNQNSPDNFQDFSLRDPTGTPIGNFPITGGLRSGDTNTTLSIDDVINRDNPTATSTGSHAPGVFSVAGAFTDPQFSTIIRALNQKKGVDLLCSAGVLTRPGERAVIKQVREFIHPTEYDPPEIPNQIAGPNLFIVDLITGNVFSPPSGTIAATPANPAAFETRELGKVLEVEPIIGPDNLTVDLNLTVDMSDFVGFVNYGSPIVGRQEIQTGFVLFPPFFLTTTVTAEVTENRILMPVFDATKETATVQVYDGQTIAIGGLMGETVDKVQDKVPGLGDLPVAGRLFRKTIDERFKRAIVIFATVRILDPGGQPINDFSNLDTGQAVN
ncbi:MAG: hypothetical protein KDM91_20710 [Verrucomicrobiae bacterium]|nr:hypothetical protein [Verrucomicrobiae bacterium]